MLVKCGRRRRTDALGVCVKLRHFVPRDPLEEVLVVLQADDDVRRQAEAGRVLPEHLDGARALVVQVGRLRPAHAIDPAEKLDRLFAFRLKGRQAAVVA